jgi:hypothetical protein
MFKARSTDLRILCEFPPENESVANTRKASDCPQIRVTVRKFVSLLSANSRHLPQLGNNANLRTGHTQA